MRPTELADELPLSDTKLATAVQHLEEAGFAEVLDDGTIVAADEEEADIDEAVEQAGEAEEHRQAFDRSRVEMMRAYAETDGCRRAFVLGYFGEGYDPPCGSCDVCERLGTEVDREERRRARSRSASGSTTPTWGTGTVGQVEDGQVTVVFDTVGYKTLALDLVEERGLLEPSAAAILHTGTPRRRRVGTRGDGVPDLPVLRGHLRPRADARRRRADGGPRRRAGRLLARVPVPEGRRR